MQQIIYFAFKIIHLDKISDEFLTKCSHELWKNFPETTSDAPVNFLSFCQSEGTQLEDTNRQFFECCLIIKTHQMYNFLEISVANNAATPENI